MEDKKLEILLKIEKEKSKEALNYLSEKILKGEKLKIIYVS
jgi:hypothetical protein